MQSPSSKDLDLTTWIPAWTPRQSTRHLPKAQFYSIWVLLSTADLCHRKGHDLLTIAVHFWSWLISGQLTPTVLHSTHCPRLPSPEICWQCSSCEHWVTTRDGISAPLLLLPAVAGLVTITMEVIINRWKWEHPHWTIYRTKSPRFPKCHKEMPFPQYCFKPRWNSVRKYEIYRYTMKRANPEYSS